jgi:hypothetical protein
MADRTGLFAGDDPFALARAWLAEAEKSEINDPNAIALASVDADGLPNVRMVLLKDIEGDGQRRRRLRVLHQLRQRQGAGDRGLRQGGLRDALEKPAPPDPGARPGRAGGGAARPTPISPPGRSRAGWAPGPRGNPVRWTAAPRSWPRWRR